MLSVSFYRPLDYFSNTFNRLAAWVTSGEFCHCELVVHTTPDQLMTTIKNVYSSAQAGQYSPTDCNRILGQIEMYFFETGFRKVAQTQENVSISFSLLWGHPMSVRVLQKTAHDTWFKIPEKDDQTATMVDVPNVTPEQMEETVRFAIEELGKNYDSSGALFSWLPLMSNERASRKEAYFCSEFVVTALQRIDKIKNIDALHTTPNALYTRMESIA